MQKDKIIPIAFICDENYVMPTGVALTSLIANKKPETVYEVHVFGVEISEKSANTLSSMSAQNTQVSVHAINDKYKDITDFEHTYVTSAACAKFDIPNLLPNYDKILYIDSDTIITSDLSELFNTDIETVYAGVVEDMYSTLIKPEHKNFNVDKFFNTGVLLLNAKKLRDEKMAEKLLETKIKINDPYIDNASFVVTFDKNVKYLSPIFNYMNPGACFTNEDFFKFYHDDKFEPLVTPPPPPKPLLSFTLRQKSHGKMHAVFTGMNG